MASKVLELIFIPSPGVGHIMSTVEIAKLLVNRNQRLAITVLVIKPRSLDSGMAITSYIESLAKSNMDRISFIQLPQDETLLTHDPKDHMSYFNVFIPSHCKYVRNVVADMISQAGSGRIVGFVIDMFCTCMIDVANEFNVPTYMFFTSSAAFLGFEFYIQKLCDDLNEDVIELSNADAEISIPSFVKPVPTKVFWSRVKTREGLDFVLGAVRKFREVKAIMVNTFLELETHAIKSLSADVSIPAVWLDSQPPSSVVFLCFGSMGSFSEVQVKEIARALEQSGHRFVCDYEDPSLVLPEGFLERTCGIGKVIGWAPQAAVLGHDAVGGFVSHCGWNSLLESLWFDVPLATWPMYAEQHMNAFEMVVELGLAVEIKLDYMKNVSTPRADTIFVTAEEIERGIKRVMEDMR
ncbi:putative flavonol 3-O-glucosyltransferase [Helianthus annuus]|nr:putative flavonol 3-O-glucosyltransferase [Helianthus annuus]